MNRDPSKKQMQYVIDKFKTILPLAKLDEQLDMEEGKVSCEGHKCGTVHCIAGWYVVANRNNKVIKYAIKEGYCSYSYGSNLMANDLGFNSESELEGWVRVNHEKWGNIYGMGMGMFANIEAYDGAKNMKQIVEFLEKVKERL